MTRPEAKENRRQHAQRMAIERWPLPRRWISGAAQDLERAGGACGDPLGVRDNG